MSILRRNIFFGFFTIVLFAACSTTKHLPPNEKLYTGASVEVNSSELTTKERKVIRGDLQGLTRPKPNSRFLGIPFKLHIYNLFRKSKPNSFFGKFRDKSGEPPVLLSSVDLQNNMKLLQNHLENNGFFKAMVTGDTSVKGKKGSAKYIAETGAQYKINTVLFDSSNSQLSRAMAEGTSKTFLKIGEPLQP